AAAAIAARLNEPMVLAHVVDDGDPESVLGVERIPRTPLQLQLHEEAQAVRSQGVEVSEELLTGIPDEALVELADKSEGRLVVLAALGWRSGSWWRLGGTAERVVQMSKAPVLIVRDAEGFEAWAQGRRPLKVILGYDFSSSSEAAFRWL